MKQEVIQAVAIDGIDVIAATKTSIYAWTLCDDLGVAHISEASEIFYDSATTLGSLAIEGGFVVAITSKGCIYKYFNSLWTQLIEKRPVTGLHVERMCRGGFQIFLCFGSKSVKIVRVNLDRVKKQPVHAYETCIECQFAVDYASGEFIYGQQSQIQVQRHGYKTRYLNEFIDWDKDDPLTQEDRRLNLLGFSATGTLLFEDDGIIFLREIGNRNTLIESPIGNSLENNNGGCGCVYASKEMAIVVFAGLKQRELAIEKFRMNNLHTKSAETIFQWQSVNGEENFISCVQNQKRRVVLGTRSGVIVFTLSKEKSSSWKQKLVRILSETERKEDAEEAKLRNKSESTGSENEEEDDDEESKESENEEEEEYEE